MRPRSLLVAGLLVLITVGVAGVWADPPTFLVDRLVRVSGESPFAGCTADDVGGQPGTVFLHSEVEPWLDVNPNNASHFVGGWQADRWSDGGARGNVAGVSFDGGRRWTQVVIPRITLCSGGTAANGGDFQRATDPWVIFSPSGHVYFFSLSLDITPPPDRPAGFGKNAMLVSKSTDGGLTWGDPITLIRDEDPRFLNDKNSITADPDDASFVYAVWDRLVVPVGTIIHPELVLGFRGPAYFSRTTNGGQSWEPARSIYDPGGNNQTLGNQVVVLTDGTLLDFFNEILSFRNDDKGRHFDFNLSHVRSTDRGASWTTGPAHRGPKMQSLALFRLFGVVDPDTGQGIRTGDLLFDVAVDRSPGSAAFGTVYAVWQDASFSGFSHDEVAFSKSTNGGFTWTAPIKINRTPTTIPPGSRQAFTPSVHVAGDGTVGVTYYDFRNNTADPTTLPTDYFIVHCHPATSACTSTADWIETQLTERSFDMRRTPLARGFFTGDYEGLGNARNAFAAFFSQSHGSDPAICPWYHTATRMHSRWDDGAARGLDPLDLLVHASRLVGAETSLAVWGGGNTSIKVTEPDLRGRPVRVLRVKGSGSDLKSVSRKDFPGVRLDDVLPLLEREDMGDQEMVDYLARCLQEPTSPRPSIETLLHGFLPFEAVIHTHADAIVALTNTERGGDTVRAVFGKDTVSLPYRRPGFRLSVEVAGAVRAHPGASGVVLEKHGLITWGGTLKEAYLATIDLVSRAEAHLEGAARGRRVFGPPTVADPDAARRRAVAEAVAPVLRGLLGRERRVLLRFDDGADVRELASAPEAAALTRVGPATPDHTIYSKRLPCFVPLADPGSPEAVIAALRPAVEAFARDYTAYFEAHRFEGAALLDPYPRVVLLPGLGMFTSGKDARTAAIVADIYRHTAWVLRAASGIGCYVSLTPAEAFGVEYWPLELYKLTLAPPEQELARRVALVTGAAGGIGRAVARRLARQGAHVVVADLDGAGAAHVADEIAKEAGPHRAVGVAMDVTSEAGVEAGLRAAIGAYGGLDVVVSNAGIAHSASLDRMALSDWERSFAVNATGHFLVTRAALRVLRAQALGGSLVYVATKNVMAPGKDFAAYSAAKAAEAQLAKVAAIEGGPHGIRANIVNPDAVFRDSGLWSQEVRRERARAQGIGVEELEAFYRKRNLLGVAVEPEDVAEAVLFLASDRSAKTTGCTLTVDGGLREAFPR